MNPIARSKVVNLSSTMKLEAYILKHLRQIEWKFEWLFNFHSRETCFRVYYGSTLIGIQYKRD
jgi:hypothetical protein